MDRARALSQLVCRQFLAFVLLALSLALASSAQAQQTIVLQQGLNGYAGTIDSKIAHHATRFQPYSIPNLLLFDPAGDSW